jgi:hypothetical protein
MCHAATQASTWNVPLDDVLAYRRENAEAHRRYMQNRRSFALDLSLIENSDHERAISDRRADLADEARDYVVSVEEPEDVAGFGLGLTGAAWSATGNPGPAALGALGAGLRMLPSWAPGSAYSYPFRARRELPQLTGLQTHAAAIFGGLKKSKGGSR